MTDAQPAPPTPRYHLRTLGTPALLGPDGAHVLGTHGQQARRLALLAAIAAAGEQGRSRDQLLLLFWPDATQSRARHSLTQLLYELRGVVGEPVFAGTNPLRLDARVVASDVSAFRSALDHGDLAGAVRAYGGPFLEGFYLSDAPEFERWMEDERARLAARHADALERLARAADEARDHAAAVRWWRALAELDPVSGRYAAGLIRAHLSAGDHAAALRHAERYEATVARELGTSAGPTVAALVAEARAVSAREGRVARATPTASPPSTTTHAAEETPTPQRQPARAPRRRPAPTLLAALAVAVVVLASVAWPRTGSRASGSAAAAERSIAVLPFANVGGDPRDAAIVDGLTEAMMAALVRIPDLRVIARGSAFAFRDSPLDPRRVGDSLRVSHLLEGSVQRSGSRIRVQVRLVDARDGATRWSETYDREREDVFAVQSAIASAVARELDLRLSAGAARRLRQGPTRSVVAYELYLRGRDPVRLRSPTDSGPLHGLALLHEAVALDSGFAAAYAAMPYMHFSLAGLARTAQQAGEHQRLALAAARRALALDPSLPEAHAGLAVALSIGFSDLGGAEAALRRAIELGGSPRVHEHLSRVLMWSGRHEEALAEALRAVEEDPLSATAAADVGEALCVTGRHEEGLAQLRRLATLRPPLRRAGGYMAVCHAMQGHWSEAIAELRDGMQVDGPFAPLLGFALARSGAVDEARRLQSEAIERWRHTDLGALRVASVAAGLRDLDEAFEWIDRAGYLDDASSLMYPLYAELHADPRFERFRARMGLRSAPAPGER